MKCRDIKRKVAKKAAECRAKVAKNCGKAASAKPAVALVALVAFAATLTACQNPAQRSQTCTVSVYAYDASRVTLGTESVTLAQTNETGGNDAGLTATPTTTVSPQTSVSVPVNKANAGTSGAGGALESVVGAAGEWVAGKIRGAGGTEDAAGGGTASGGAACSDGECAECSDGECTPK